MIETFAPIFNGFYETSFQFDYDVDSFLENALSEKCSSNVQYLLSAFVHNNYYDCLNDDYVGYKTDVAKAVCEFLSEKVTEMLGVKTTFVFQSIYSPKYYNYRNDSINVGIETDNTLFMNALLKYIKDNFDDFKEYIKNNYTSYDGFCSFYSNDADDWLKQEYNDHEIGSMLEFALRDYYDDVYTDLVYYCVENVFADNYASLTNKFEVLLDDDKAKAIFNEYERLCTQKENYFALMKELNKEPNYKAINEQEEKNIQSLCNELKELL